MNTKTQYSLNEAQLIFAKQTNGEVWKLLEKDQLTDDEQGLLLYTAFASSYHWNSVGNLANKQRGEWLISRAYSKLGMGNSALFHAKKCFDLTQNEHEELQDFDFAYSVESLARSYAALGEMTKAQIHYDKATAYGDVISNEGDRKLFFGDLRSGDWNGFNPSERLT